MRILYVDLDTLRPDHLGCYGYHRDTSPNLDAVARQGVRFDNYYCTDAPCLPSRAALLSGQYGIHTGAVGHCGTAADFRLEGGNRGFRTQRSARTLAPTLRKAGFHTTTISPFAERHSLWQWYAGYKEMYNTGKGGMESAEEVTPVVLDWVERNAEKDNWFLHVNYWDPHTPYRAPEEFGDPFKDDPLPAWLTPEILEKHRQKVGPHSAREIAMYDSSTSPRFPRHPGEIKDMQDMRRMLDGYDCGIRYVDGHVGQLFDALEKAGVLEDTAIIISSDHGENQGELGIYGEHATADNITCRIPMIVRWPGAQGGHADSGLHLNIDLLPTLAELFDLEAADAWDGRSYAAALTKGEDCGREYNVISQCAHVCQRSVRFGPWLYMRTYHDGYHLFPPEMLYNIEEDPHEQNDLAAERADICKQAAWYLQEWHDQMMATMPAGYTNDPLWTVIEEGGPCHARGQLKKYCERLKETDRGWAVEELQRRHPHEFK